MCFCVLKQWPEIEQNSPIHPLIHLQKPLDVFHSYGVAGAHFSTEKKKTDQFNFNNYDHIYRITSQ